MAKTQTAQTQRADRGGSSFIAAGVAILAVALFLGWLATREPDTAVAVTEPGADTPAQPTDIGPITVVDAEELATTARVNELRGQQIQLNDVEVVSSLGPQLFWLQLPGGSPFLARLDPALVEAGTVAPSSGRFQLVGVIHEKPDALLTEWQQAGVLRSDGDRMQAEYGSSYIEARRLTPAAR